MRIRSTLVVALVATVFGVGAKADSKECRGLACDSALVFVGTHTGGPGQGIFAVRLNEQTGALTAGGVAAEVERPTWLERDPQRDIVYSVSETGNDGKSNGAVFSLAIDRAAGTLRVISKVDSGGGGATHLSYDPRSRMLFVANYGTGQVSAIPVGRDGVLAPVSSVQRQTGSGPNKRQQSAHAHAAVVDPSGRFVLSADLGADKVFVYRYVAASRSLEPAKTPFLAFPGGTGPRHIAFSPRGAFAFVDAELTGQVFTLRWNAQTGSLSQTSVVALDAPDYTGTRSAAELATSSDGRFLYVSNRGQNLLHVFSIDRKTGALTEIQRLSCGGLVPWSFKTDPTGKWLIVANEASSSLAVFSVDRATGKLRDTNNRLDVPKPVTLTFAQ